MNAAAVLARPRIDIGKLLPVAVAQCEASVVDHRKVDIAQFVFFDGGPLNKSASGAPRLALHFSACRAAAVSHAVPAQVALG
jgi:hypothetical protein